MGHMRLMIIIRIIIQEIGIINKISVATQIGENLKYKVSETWNGLLVNSGVYIHSAGVGNVVDGNTMTNWRICGQGV